MKVIHTKVVFIFISFVIISCVNEIVPKPEGLKSEINSLMNPEQIDSLNSQVISNTLPFVIIPIELHPPLPMSADSLKNLVEINAERKKNKIKVLLTDVLIKPHMLLLNNYEGSSFSGLMISLKDSNLKEEKINFEIKNNCIEPYKLVMKSNSLNDFDSILGFVEYSRIVYNSSYDYCLFYTTFYTSHEFVIKELLFAKKVNNNWDISQREVLSVGNN